MTIKNWMLRNEGTQTFIAQTVMKAFIDGKCDRFDAFLAAWKSSKGTSIHESTTSPQSLVFGSYQSALSTFVGFCHPSKSIIERKGGIFGIYLTIMTSSMQYPQPVLVSPDSFLWLDEISKNDTECRSIISFLLKKSLICFSATPYVINTPFPESPPLTVPDERPAFHTVMQLEAEAHELATKVTEPVSVPMDQNKDTAEYQMLLDEMRAKPA